MPNTSERDSVLSTLASAAYSNAPPAQIANWSLGTQVTRPSGFSAVIYVDLADQQVALSFRGTDNLLSGDALADLAFATGHWNQQFQEAVDLVRQIQSGEVPEIPFPIDTNQLLVTGHSLGGGIAQLMAEAFNLRGASFDAPGTSAVARANDFQAFRLMREMQEAEIRQDDAGFTASVSQFINYVSEGSAISSVASHFGDVKKIVNLTNPSITPFLVGMAGAVTGGAALGFLGLMGTGNVLSSHPMSGIEQAMRLSAEMAAAHPDGESYSMLSVPASQVTGQRWTGEGDEPRVIVFRGADGQIAATVDRTGDAWAITPSRRTVAVDKAAAATVPTPPTSSTTSATLQALLSTYRQPTIEQIVIPTAASAVVPNTSIDLFVQAMEAFSTTASAQRDLTVDQINTAKAPLVPAATDLTRLTTDAGMTLQDLLSISGPPAIEQVLLPAYQQTAAEQIVLPTAASAGLTGMNVDLFVQAMAAFAPPASAQPYPTSDEMNMARALLLTTSH